MSRLDKKRLTAYSGWTVCVLMVLVALGVEAAKIHDQRDDRFLTGLWRSGKVPDRLDGVIVDAKQGRFESARLELGRLQEWMQRYDPDLDFFSISRKSTNLAQVSAGTHLIGGLVEINQNEGVQAIRHFRQAVELDPDNVDAKQSLALALSSFNSPVSDMSESRELLSAAEKIVCRAYPVCDDFPDYLETAARVHLVNGDYEAAAAAAQRALLYRPGSLKSHVVMFGAMVGLRHCPAAQDIIGRFAGPRGSGARLGWIASLVNQLDECWLARWTTYWQPTGYLRALGRNWN